METAFVTANWEFHGISDTNPAAPPTLLPCPAGFDRAEVRLTSLTGGTDFIDTYPCDAMTGTEAYDPDLYEIELLITGPGGTYAVSPSEGLPAVEIDTRDVDKTVNFGIADNGGYFGFAWNLVDAVTNAPLSCNDVNPDSIEILGTLAGTTFAKGDQFPCGDLAAVTAAYPEGAYTMSVSAVEGDAALGVADPVTTSIGDRNDFANLGTITIPID